METWGRGTNEVIDACKKYGVEPPVFSERTGMLVVAFRAAIAPEPRSRLDASKGHQVGTKSALSRHQVDVLRLALKPTPLPKLMRHCGTAATAQNSERQFSVLFLRSAFSP